MIGAVAAKLADMLPVMESAHLMFSVAACGTPFVFVLHGSVMIAAPLVARHARPQLRLRWWVTLVAGVAVWCGAGLLFLLLLPVLIL